MIAIYIASLEPGAGRTALCAGLARWLVQQGKRVGVFKPILLTEKAEADQDTLFLKEVLGLKEDAEALCPLALTPGMLEEALASLKDGALGKVPSAYATLSQGKDVVLAEGLGSLAPGSLPARASAEVCRLLRAKALVLARYRPSLTAQELREAASIFGDGALLVINAVPTSRLEEVRETLATPLEGQGVKVLGLIPEERSLLAFSVGELAEHLGGKFVVYPEGGPELVENIVVGAVSMDPANLYLGRREKKAVITRGDRPDVQLAALETASTSCLVLTQGKQPFHYVLARAREKGVPVVVVEPDTLASLARLEELSPRVRFRQPRKLERLDVLLRQHLDLGLLSRSLGLD